MQKKLQSEFTKRQYMLSRDFEIYYYSDTGHKNITPHKHNYYEFYFYLEGDVDFEYEANRYHLREGDFLVIPPEIPHRAVVNKTEGKYGRFVFWVGRDFFDRMCERFHTFRFLPDYVKKPDSQHLFHNDPLMWNWILSKIIQLLEELHSGGFGKEDLAVVRVEDLLMHLNRIIYNDVCPNRGQEELPLYASVIDYIDHHLDEDLSLERLGSLFYVSKYSVAHSFKDNVGISVYQYIIKKRLEACCQEIIMGQKASEICLEYGFHDYPTFFRAFKKEYGISPREFMKKVSLEKLTGQSE